VGPIGHQSLQRHKGNAGRLDGRAVAIGKDARTSRAYQRKPVSWITMKSTVRNRSSISRRTAGLAILCVALAAPAILVGCSPSTSPLPAMGEEARRLTGYGEQLAQNSTKGETTMEKAIFGAGCFWGVEAAFRQTPGVVSTAVGYSGGHTIDPTYEQVCGDRTGHAEVVQVEFDPSQVSYEQLLDVFWKSHDPTQVDRQGPDVGSQYRTAIFYLSPEQKATAEASKARLDASGKLGRPVATEIAAAGTFWRAEEYHQQYLEKRGLASCHIRGK